MTKEVISDFLKTASYFYRRGVSDASAQYGDLTVIDEYLKSNPLCEPYKFRFIDGDYMSLKPITGPGFERMFANIITSRLPNIAKRRELCSGALFAYIRDHGFYVNEIRVMCIHEYHRGLECGKTIDATTGEEFLMRFYDGVSYDDIDPLTGKIIPRTKSTYNIFLMYQAANILHPKRREALQNGYKITSKLHSFAAKLQKISFMISK